MKHKHPEGEDCSHPICNLVGSVATVADTVTEFVEDTMELAVLAGALAIQLEGDKGEDDDRLERRVLMKLERMGMLHMVVQELCDHDPSKPCEECGWEPEEEKTPEPN